jgi:hypothetical protein
MMRFNSLLDRGKSMMSGQAKWVPALLAAILLAACGGGGGGGGGSAPNSSPARDSVVALEPTAPQPTGDSATDSINWFNFRRQQIGLPALARNASIDVAALGHSRYQTFNGITHIQTEGKQGFTGACLYDDDTAPIDPVCAASKVSRLEAAGYSFPPSTSYAFGEVIVRTGDASGFNGAEDLIAAIYHRFVAFEPAFKEVGSGAATAPDGAIYMTTDFAVSGSISFLGSGNTVVYPFANQPNVPRNFLSDTESPDPVADRNEVGYPISIHADISSTLVVESFTVRPRGGAPLAAQLLSSATDAAHTPKSVASILPLDVLAPATTYDVEFRGTVDGISADRTWSFTTR